MKCRVLANPLRCQPSVVVARHQPQQHGRTRRLAGYDPRNDRHASRYVPRRLNFHHYLNMTRQVIGIDFGTTFSSVSFLPLGSPDKPNLLQFSGARHHVPTLLRLDPNDDSLEDWGWTAQDALPLGNGVVVERNFKRDFGKCEKSKELTLHYLKALEEKIRDKQGLPRLEEADFITSIGAPANWTEAQKDLLERLAIEAGFPEVRIVPEPVAAMHNLRCNAIARFRFGVLPETFMVIDFGGGTLDICVVKTQELGREPQVLSIDGDPKLGGVDFDDILEKWFLKQSDLDLDSMSLNDKALLRENIQDAKENMSDMFRKKGGESFQSTIHLTTGAHVFEATKNGFFNRCEAAGYLEKISGAVGRALQKCGLQPRDIKRVILTGGSSRWFFVRQLVAKEMGLGGEDELLETDNPYTDVASGLSICFGRSDEPGARPGVWLKYQLPGEESQQKMLVAPGRANLVRNDRLYLGDISGTKLFQSREISFEWLQGAKESKLDSNGRSKLSVYFRSNHPKIQTLRNTWDALRGRETKPRDDTYKAFINTTEDPLHVHGIVHKVELVDNRGEVRVIFIRAGEHVRYTWWGLGEPVRTDLNLAGRQKSLVQAPPTEAGAIHDIALDEANKDFPESQAEPNKP